MTEAIKDLIEDPAANLGFITDMGEDGTLLEYESSESDNSENRPKVVIETDPTGIEKQVHNKKNLNISLLENPGTSLLVTLPLNTISNKSISLTGVNGKKYLTYNFNSTSVRLDISQVPSGMYVITIQGVDTNFKEKVIISR